MFLKNLIESFEIARSINTDRLTWDEDYRLEVISMMHGGKTQETAMPPKTEEVPAAEPAAETDLPKAA